MKRTYLSSSGCKSSNDDSPRRFPEALEKCNLEFLDPGHLLGQTLVGDILKVTSEFGEVDSTDSEKITVAKMASHAIFQYNILAIDDTHNTWTNVIVKMTILRLLGSSDDKEKIGVARPKGPPLRWFR